MSVNNELNNIKKAFENEKAENDINLNETEYNDYYLGYRDGITFAIDYINNYLKKSNITTTLDFNDIREMLDREG